MAKFSVWLSCQMPKKKWSILIKGGQVYRDLIILVEIKAELVDY